MCVCVQLHKFKTYEVFRVYVTSLTHYSISLFWRAGIIIFIIKVFDLGVIVCSKPVRRPERRKNRAILDSAIKSAPVKKWTVRCQTQTTQLKTDADALAEPWVCSRYRPVSTSWFLNMFSGASLQAVKRKYSMVNKTTSSLTWKPQYRTPKSNPPYQLIFPCMRFSGRDQKFTHQSRCLLQLLHDILEHRTPPGKGALRREILTPGHWGNSQCWRQHSLQSIQQHMALSWRV